LFENAKKLPSEGGRVSRLLQRPQTGTESKGTRQKARQREKKGRGP